MCYLLYVRRMSFNFSGDTLLSKVVLKPGGHILSTGSIVIYCFQETGRAMVRHNVIPTLLSLQWDETVVNDQEQSNQGKEERHQAN